MVNTVAGCRRVLSNKLERNGKYVDLCSKAELSCLLELWDDLTSLLLLSFSSFSFSKNKEQLFYLIFSTTGGHFGPNETGESDNGDMTMLPVINML
jgi:hypothetical protein